MLKIKTIKMNNSYYQHRKLIFLELGEDYLVSMWGKPASVCRLIQPTPKGFNLLDLETNKCVLRFHLYPWKKITTVLHFLFIITF